MHSTGLPWHIRVTIVECGHWMLNGQADVHLKICHQVCWNSDAMWPCWIPNMEFRCSSFPPHRWDVPPVSIPPSLTTSLITAQYQAAKGHKDARWAPTIPIPHAHWPSILNPTRWMLQSSVNDFADALTWEGQFPGEYCLPHFFSEVLISYPIKQANVLDDWNDFHPLLSPDAASRLSSTTNDHSRPLMHAVLWGTTTTGREYHPTDMANKLSRMGWHG